MKNRDSHIVDKYLESLEGFQDAEAPPQLYAKTRARMERGLPAVQPALFRRPALLAAVLLLLLLCNGALLFSDRKQTSAQPAAIDDFMELYNQQGSASY